MSCDELTTYSDVWIDDDLLQDEGIAVLLSSEEPALPALRNLNVTVPGRHGAYDFGAYFEPREFTLNIVFKRQDYADLKRDIRKLNRRFVDDYGRPKTVKLRFGDEVDKYYNVRVTQAIPVERTAERGFITLGLTAFDPYAYSVLASEEITWGSEVVTFEYTYHMGYIGSGGIAHITDVPTTLSVDVEGLALRPTIRITGSADELYINANGKSTRILEPFIDAEWLIKGETYEVLKNGTHTWMDETGDFIELLSGRNYVGITGTNLDIEIEFIYRERFI